MKEHERTMRPSRGPRIFIADDDPGIVDLLRTRLELAGYETAYARDGASAVEGIRHTQPAGVVLDLGMPRLDGFAVLRALRSQAATRATPVMVLTARHAPDDVRRAVSCGAQDYLSKPFDDAQLLRRIARLLRARTPVAPRASIASAPASSAPPAGEADGADLWL